MYIEALNSIAVRPALQLRLLHFARHVRQREFFYNILLDIVRQRIFFSILLRIYFAGHCPAETIFMVCWTLSGRNLLYFAGHCPTESIFFFILLDIVQQRIYFAATPTLCQTTPIFCTIKAAGLVNV